MRLPAFVTYVNSFEYCFAGRGQHYSKNTAAKPVIAFAQRNLKLTFDKFLLFPAEPLSAEISYQVYRNFRAFEYLFAYFFRQTAVFKILRF